MVTKKFWAILVLVLIVAGLATFEQVYTDNTIATLKTEITNLDTLIDSENLQKSSEKTQNIIDFWKKREIVICLFVDYRDIEAIGKQADLVKSHLSNQDFELAKVECHTLLHVVTTFGEMIGFDWHNVF